MNEEHPAYITVYLSMGGWQSVLMSWDKEFGGYTPWQTGFNNTSIGKGTRKGAIVEAQGWAEDEQIEYKGPKK